MIPLLIATLEGDTELLGRSWFRRAAHAAARTGRTAEHAASKAVRTVAHVDASVGRAVGHGVATGAREVGHLTAAGMRIAEREAKRIIRAVARPMLAAALHGDGSFGDSAARDLLHKERGALVAGITTAATGAVAASGIATPAAPAVPILLPPILDQLIDEVGKKGKQILLGPDKTPDATDSVSGSGIMGSSIAGIPVPVVIVAAGGLVAFLVLHHRKA